LAGACNLAVRRRAGAPVKAQPGGRVSVAEAYEGVDARASATLDQPGRTGLRTLRPARRTVRVVTVAAAAVGLFIAYLRMARAFPINADGASNALQAWDMFHGNPLLHGWTLSDVSFYSTELIQYGLLQLFLGLNADIVHVAAAMTYTLLVLVVAALAKGRSTGRAAAVRVGLALVLMLVPAPGIAYRVLLSSLNHTGTAVVLLVTWFVLDRMQRGDRARRLLPYVIGGLLTWGQLADPLMLFIGVVPLVLVAAWRLGRDRTPGRPLWRGLDARLIVAAAASFVFAHGLLLAVRLVGGFRVLAPPIRLSPPAELGERVGQTARMVGNLFSTYYSSYLPRPVSITLSVIHFVGILLALGAAVAVVVAMLRRRSTTPDRVDAVMAVGIVVNLVAQWVSTLPTDGFAAREIVAVLPLGAALAGRVLAPRLRPVRLAAALVPVLAFQVALLVAHAPVRAVPAANQDIADWLVARDLRYGLGAYWGSNNITVTTGRRVQVVPMAGSDHFQAYCWQAKRDWYDARRHDARFVVLDLRQPVYGNEEAAIAQFGTPTEDREFGRYMVLVFDYNLLDRLGYYCA
jgi:hypothetical protein